MSNAFKKQVAGSHYNGMAIQPAEFCQRNRLPYLESCVVRYITRHGQKNGRQDIEKAIHCLEMLKQLEYPCDPTKPIEFDGIKRTKSIPNMLFVQATLELLRRFYARSRFG